MSRVGLNALDLPAVEEEPRSGRPLPAAGCSMARGCSAWSPRAARWCSRDRRAWRPASESAHCYGSGSSSPRGLHDTVSPAVDPHLRGPHATGYIRGAPASRTPSSPRYRRRRHGPREPSWPPQVTSRHSWTGCSAASCSPARNVASVAIRPVSRTRSPSACRAAASPTAPRGPQRAGAPGRLPHHGSQDAVQASPDRRDR